VSLFDGDHAAVGPGGLRDGAHGVAQLIEGDVEFLAAGSDGAEDAAGAVGVGVGVGDEDVEGEHIGLDGDVGILPLVEGVDGHVTVLGGWGYHVQLLALHVSLGAQAGLGFLGGFGGQRGSVAAGEKQTREREGQEKR